MKEGGYCTPLIQLGENTVPHSKFFTEICIASLPDEVEFASLVGIAHLPFSAESLQ